MAGHERIPVIAVTGPTACGKTQVAVELCRRIGGEVVCADSMQVYGSLRIGTTVPDEGQMGHVRHHLYGCIPPESAYSVAQYQNDAQAAAREIHGRGQIPVLCGGTGLYISSFMRETDYGNTPVDEALRGRLWARLRDEGPESLLDEIAAKDAGKSAIHPSNHKRIVRALEKLGAGEGRSSEIDDQESHSEKDFLVYPAIIICTDRKKLYNRINGRVDTMMRHGLLDEARWVYDNRDRFATVCQAIGYKEFFGYFEGVASLEDCVEGLKKASRHYAKRQITWFRNTIGAREYPVDDQTAEQVAGSIERDWKEFLSQRGGTRGV